MRLEHLLSGALQGFSWSGETQVAYFSQNVFRNKSISSLRKCLGGLAQLARALAWHARGHRFDPDILHVSVGGNEGRHQEEDL